MTLNDLPAWHPSFEQTAAYVPWLTVSTGQPGAQSYLGTFSANTSPSDTVAVQHIGDAMTLITGSIATMPATLYPLAEVVTAKYAAATLAAAYARSDEDKDRAAALLAEAKAGLAGLIDAADNTGAASLSAAPVLVAPDPVPWGDSLLIDGAAPPWTYPHPYYPA